MFSHFLEILVTILLESVDLFIAITDACDFGSGSNIYDPNDK